MPEFCDKDGWLNRRDTMTTAAKAMIVDAILLVVLTVLALRAGDSDD